MANKKAGSAAKNSNAQQHTTTKVTTLKAVESRPDSEKQSVSSKATNKLGLLKTPIAAALVAEFIGTFIFAAVFVAGQGQPILALFALAGVVLAVGSISGGYVNPALVVGSWITRRMSGQRAIAYIVAQILGAMLALVILNLFVNAAPAADPQTVGAAPSLFQAAALPKDREGYIFLSEFIGTAILAFAAASAYRELRDRTAKALTLGLGIFLGLMVAGSAAAFLGASAILNPALAISLQALNFDSQWPIVIYVLGSILGAIAGYGLYHVVNNAQKSDA